MPIYRIQAPDGKIYRIEGPPGASDEDLFQTVAEQNPTAVQAAPKEGIMAALAGGAKRMGSTFETGLESLIDPNLAAQRGVARSEALGQEYAPGASLEKVKQAYAEKGLFPAAYEAISQIPTAISENVPNIAATLAGGRTGAMAGSVFGPVGALIGGGVGAAAPSLLQLYGSGLERQAQEGSKDVSRTAALGAAVPGAAAEVVSTYIPLGRTFIGKLLGPSAEKALAKGTNEGIETAAKESVMATLAKGTAIGAGVEIPTEVGQQMLERLQAGLPLTTPDALKEYGESAYGAALVGGPFGAAARAAGRPGAREEYQAIKQQEEQAAFDAERQAALDKYNAEEAEAQQQRDITRGQLGTDTSKMLALPAPDKEVKPTDETRELINPVGDITRDELAPEVTKYIDKYRKDNELPRLKTFSVEDVKDAMTQVNPKGEQAALDSILTAKTGYTGEQKYTPEIVLDAAVEKNVATETKGFNDFLTRVTGTNTLDTMTQPQLFAAFKALKDMKREDTTQQLVLPEGSNASRYTQKQYDQALNYVRSSFEESGNKPLSTETILTDIKDSTKLETERDAMALLDAAIKNEDLSQSREVVFRTYREGQERPVATYRDKAKAQAAAKKQGLNVKEEALVQVAPAEAKVAPETKRAPLPTGYEIKESLLDSGTAPAEFAITPEGRGKRLTAVPTEGEATAKIPKLQALRAQRAAQMDANIAKSEGQITKGQAQLDRLEADGKGDTEQYKVLQAKQASRVKTMNSRIELFKRQKEEFLASLQAKPAGQKTLTRQAFTVSKDGKSVGSFPSRQAAEESILTNLPDEELAKVASDTRFGGITDRAVREQERRKEGKTGIEVKGTAEGLEKAGVETPALKEKLKTLEDKLVPLLSKFGLKDVALNVVKSIERNAEGSYIDKLIKIAMDAENPIRTMRHEALHAMKELGFFTDAQWKALEKQAKAVWIDKYLVGQMAKVGDKVMTRLEAYRQMGLSEAEIIEEAIADAFGDFDTAGKAPPGMLQALFKRMQQFFAALRQALGGAGFESAEEIFGKIERGELKAGKQAGTEGGEKFSLAPKGIPQNIWDLHEKAEEADAAARGDIVKERGLSRGAMRRNQTMAFRRLNKAVLDFVGGDEQKSLNLMVKMNEETSRRERNKYSLSGAGVPMSTRNLMEADDTEARAELGLNTKAVRNRFNSVRDIAIALNKATKDAFGQMDQNNLTAEDMDRIAEAIADEVGYQLSTTSETGTGTGWYSTNYPNAVKRLAKRFPELETNPTARSVFSALVAVSSNGERVATNIKNAIKMYERIRQGKKMIAIGSRRATALENNLIMIQDLLDEHGDNFEQELLKTTTVKDMNAALRAKGEKADTSYLADTTVPAAAIYFGPKLGAFFANLSGAEGYLTMDLWWSRTINRMRGLLIPKATDASINTFREMIDIPSASREEVVAATIPLAAKYKEYGFNTELEHLMKSKEPKEKVNKPKWFAKAEKVVGDAYEQLLYEHKLEKIANTIHKNEFEMLEEAPFTGTDRKFMYDAARKAQGILRSRGVNLTLADVQAALWYYEKRLYQKLSGRKADDIGYEEAINSQAAKGIGRARPSVVFGGKPDSGTVAGGEITGSEELRGILADSTSDERKYSLRSGVIVEVAPNPDQEVANKWREMTPDERLNTTKAVASKAVNRVLDELGFKGYTSYFSSGKYEGEVNPNIIIEAPDGASAEDLRELASVLGYVLDQKAMVAFDENNKSSGDQNTFIKVVPPSDMSEADLERLRKHIAESVPQADGDTLRDDALLFGNFSAYNDNVETLSDKQYHQAILDAIEFFDYDGTIRVSEPETFHSEMIWPESRSDYLKGTRYGKSGEVQGREGPDVRGSGISRLQTISDEAIALRDRWIDSRGSARRGGGGERSKVDIGQPTAEYGQKRENAESVIGVHFSQQPRAVLSSYFHGNGIRGLEKERLSDPANKDIRDRAYFYIDTGRGVFPEESVGGVQHVIRLHNLYDIQKDPLKIVKTNTGVDAADRASKLERKILKAGYNGYVTRDPIQNQGFAVLVGDHYIKTNVGKYSLRTAPDTKEFKQWFGDSKVVDADGNPQVMYHGTRKDFSEFKPGLIFSSPNPMVANKFAANDMLYSPDKPGIEPGANVMPVYIKSVNPFDYENLDHVNELFEKIKGNFASVSRPAAKRLLSEGQFKIIEENVDVIKDMGFDGLYVEEFGEKNLAVFEPTQIKSATGNRGTFDATNPDIRYSLKTYFPTAEEAESAAYKKAPPGTAEFKRFFGGSRVMEEGRPQPMFHASMEEFSIFRENRPIFISPDAGFAEDFIRRRISESGSLTYLSEGEVKKKTAKIYPLWVRAETPFDYDNKDHVQQIIGYLQANNQVTDGRVQMAGLALKTPEKIAEGLSQGRWTFIEDGKTQEALKALGFDSFYTLEGGAKNLAVFKANQVKSITGNLGGFDEGGDIRYSLREFKPDDLPKNNKPYTLPKNTMIFHGAHGAAAKKIKEAGKTLLAYPGIKSSGGSMDEAGLIFFGGRETATDFANSQADQVMVEALERKEGKRLPGTVFETATDRPYKLMSRYQKLSAKEANELNAVLGLPDYKRLKAGDSADLASSRAYINSRVLKEYNIQRGEQQIPMKVTWPVIFRTLGFDGFYDNQNVPAVALTADNGIRLIGKDGKLEKFSLPSVSTAAEDRVNATTTVRDNDGYISRMLKAISPESRSYFRQQAINRYNQLSVIDKMRAEKMGGHVLMADQSAESAALMSDLGAGITASAMGFGNRMGGIPVYKNGVTTVINTGDQKGLIASLAPLAKYGDPKVYQYYQYWAAVKRGERLYAEGREQLIQPGDRKYADELLQKFPEFEQVQKDFNKFNEGLVRYMVDTGVLSEAQGREYVKHADYVPFYRQLNEEKTIGPNIFQSITGVKQPRKLKGGDAPLADFLETVVRNTQASIQAGIKNAAAQRAVNAAMDVGTDIGAERLNEVSTSPDTVTILEKGKKVSYRVADPLFIEAVKSLNIPELPFMTLLSAPSNTLRNLVTKDPGFMMANLMRDSLSAWVTSGQDIKPIIGTVQNFAKALAGRSPGLVALLNAGVVGGYEFSNVVEASAQELAKDMQRKYGSSTITDKALRPFTWVWEALEKGTEASDAATRIAVYERVMEETGNEAEALYRALEVMNFNRKGSSAVVRILTAAVPFLNARIQGLDVFYRASFGQMATKDAKAIQKAFWVRGMTLMALSSMYFFAVSDDEEYKKQEAETKDNYWIIPGVGKFPTPFEVGVLFKTIPERILAYSFKDDTGQDFKKSIQRALVNTFAFNPIPQTVKPIIEAATNYSFFTMRPIVGQGMEKVAPEFQVGPGTSKLAEMIGTELGLSPIKIDSIIRGYTGTIGMYGVQAIDAVLNANSDSPNASKRFEQLPIIKRFALDPEARGNITQYYELKNAVDSLAATSSLLEKSMKPDEWVEYMRENKGLFATTEYVRDLEKEMKELREMRRLVQTGPFSADSKRDYLTTIGQAENNLTKNIQTVKKLIASYQ